MLRDNADVVVAKEVVWSCPSWSKRVCWIHGGSAKDAQMTRSVERDRVSEYTRQDELVCVGAGFGVQRDRFERIQCRSARCSIL